MLWVQSLPIHRDYGCSEAVARRPVCVASGLEDVHMGYTTSSGYECTASCVVDMDATVPF